MFGEICTTRPRWVSSIAKYFLPLSCRASGVYWWKCFDLTSNRNLVNLIYNYLTICKWVVYKFCFWNKKQIRNKNGFLGKSSFFCLHYFSFLSLACNQSTNPSYYYAFSSWFNICFFIYPGIRSEKRKVLFSMIDINMCKVKNNHPSNQIFVYF